MKAYSLMYHDVVPPGDLASSGMSGAGADLYKLDRADFCRHLDAIAALGADRVKSCLDNWRQTEPVFITFDDGGASVSWIAAELDRRGWRGHFFITTDCIDRPAFVTAADLRQAAARGHVIGSHSCSHPMRMSALSESMLLREWRDSLAKLTDILGSSVTVASVPGGHYSRQVGETAAASGVTTLFNSEPTTAVSSIGKCLLLGRYFLQRDTPPEVAQSFAGGTAGPRRMQALAWKAKKAAKTIGGDLYVRARKAYLEGRNGPPR